MADNAIMYMNTSQPNWNVVCFCADMQQMDANTTIGNVLGPREYAALDFLDSIVFSESFSDWPEVRGYKNKECGPGESDESGPDVIRNPVQEMIVRCEYFLRKCNFVYTDTNGVKRLISIPSLRSGEHETATTHGVSQLVLEDIERYELSRDPIRSRGILWNLHEALYTCLLYTSPSPRDRQKSRMPSSA